MGALDAVKAAPGSADALGVWSSTLRAVVAAPLLSLVLTLVAGTGATAEDAASARRAAEAARAQVQQLTADLDTQLAARDQAMSALATSVQSAISTDSAANLARQQAADARGRHARAVRALYASGGELAVYVSVLGSGSLQDAIGRASTVTRLLNRVAGDARDAAGSAQRVTDLADDEQQAATRDVATVADVVAAGDRIEAALAAAQASLDALSQQASRLEAAEQARQQLEAAREHAAAAAASLGSGAHVGATAIPAGYRLLYQRGARLCPGLRWTLLAAVGQVESRHGRNNGPSSAGAIGPMQFMPATFAQYGVDGDGDGAANPWSPADAIDTAAIYLCRNGGGGDAASVQRALLRYNNAQWYVDLVLGVEADLVASGLAG